MEGIGAAWSLEIQEPPTPIPTRASPPISTAETAAKPDSDAPKEDPKSTVTLYESTIRDPKADSALSQKNNAQHPTLEVETVDPQVFLAQQLEIMERFKRQDEEDRASRARKAGGGKEPEAHTNVVLDESGVNDQIGPVQFNYGGIQVNAEDMVKRLKVSSSYIYILGWKC
jgi:dynein light intermediate chain 1, cytosolic